MRYRSWLTRFSRQRLTSSLVCVRSRVCIHAILRVRNFGVKMVEHEKGCDDCGDNYNCSYDGDPHPFFSHGTVTPQSLPGHRKPWRLPSKKLVFIRLGSIQKRWPQLGHFKRYLGSISLNFAHTSSRLALATSLLKAAIPVGLRMKT
jgi:hypothetical protein